LAPLGLILVFSFASAGSWGFAPSRGVIEFAQSLLLFLLGSGLVSSIASIARREQPRWLPIAGLILTIFVISAIALFFYSLDD
jgi:hypothetical protein